MPKKRSVSLRLPRLETRINNKIAAEDTVRGITGIKSRTIRHNSQSTIPACSPMPKISIAGSINGSTVRYSFTSTVANLAPRISRGSTGKGISRGKSREKKNADMTNATPKSKTSRLVNSRTNVSITCGWPSDEPIS